MISMVCHFGDSGVALLVINLTVISLSVCSVLLLLSGYNNLGMLKLAVNPHTHTQKIFKTHRKFDDYHNNEERHTKENSIDCMF